MPLRSIEKQLHLDATLQDLPLHQVSIAYNCPVAQVSRMLEDNALLPGVILTQAGVLKGVLSRRSFFERMSRPFSRELFARKPVLNLYQFTRKEILILAGSTSVVTAARWALQRLPELMYEPIVVQVEPHDYRLLDAHQLLLAQFQIQELTMDELERNRQALAEEKELEHVTLQSIADAVITTDALGHIKGMNPIAEKLTGWQFSEAEQKPLMQVFCVVSEQPHQPILDPVRLSILEERTVELKNQLLLNVRNGQEYAINGSVAPIRVRNEIVGTVLVCRDVTSERRMARQLSWQASHDALTGLVNRRQFEQHLEEACQTSLEKAQIHTLCCMDLDRFKLVNDTCGHLAGDELLRQLSTLMQQRIRKTDILARLGGDEFGLLLHQCPLDKGLSVAQMIHQCVNEFQFFWQGQVFKIGISIGLMAIDETIATSTTALSRADAACYRAKKQGRNRVQVYEPDASCDSSGFPTRF